MKSGAEGAHFFGALLLTFSFDKHSFNMVFSDREIHNRLAGYMCCLFLQIIIFSFCAFLFIFGIIILRGNRSVYQCASLSVFLCFLSNPL
ncbi:hypothetical protein WMO64_16770, partial [Pseudoflavonifractor sp. CLA-AP-H29]